MEVNYRYVRERLFTSLHEMRINFRCVCISLIIVVNPTAAASIFNFNDGRTGRRIPRLRILADRSIILLVGGRCADDCRGDVDLLDDHTP